MGLWDKLKESAAGLADALRDRPLHVPLTQDTLNRAIARTLPPQGDIKSLALVIHDEWFEALATVATRAGPIHVTAGFELLRLQIDQSVQQVELLPRGRAQARAERWFGKLGLVVLESVLALFGQTLLGWGLRRRDGVSVVDGRVCVELGKLGLQELVLAAARSQAGEYGALAEALLRSGAQTLMSQGAVTGGRCLEGRVLVEFRLPAVDGAAPR